GFGGTGMNHFLLFCACVPRWEKAPADAVAQVATDGKLVRDGVVSPDGFLVNNLRNPELADGAPLQTAPHIGMRLDAAGVSWSWYAGNWNGNKRRAPVRPF